jgi:PAS domain S-box-containing protein
MPDADTLLKAWVETVKDYAIFLLDTAGNVARWNEGAERLLGYTEAEIVGLPGALIFTPEDREARQPEREMGVALATGHAADDRWHARKDGSRFWASGYLTLLRDGAAKPCGFVKALRDLTERKQLEDELRRRAEELTEADRRKNEFLAMLSHELRNPLAPILNALFILRPTCGTDENPEALQARLMIERQIDHMTVMLNDLLDVSRIATHKLQLRFQRVPLGQVIDDAVEAGRPLITERRHELTVAVDPDPIPVDADPTRLEQVVVNLLNNAAKYTEPGGSIWLTARREDGEAVLRVKDTGIGIAPEMLPHVFELYRQADHSLDRQQGGLGIGLTLARDLVQLHGGTIEASSESLGKGTEFTVRLPATAQEPAAPRRPRRGEAGGSSAAGAGGRRQRRRGPESRDAASPRRSSGPHRPRRADRRAVGPRTSAGRGALGHRPAGHERLRSREGNPGREAGGRGRHDGLRPGRERGGRLRPLPREARGPRRVVAAPRRHRRRPIAWAASHVVVHRRRWTKSTRTGPVIDGKAILRGTRRS